MEHSEFDMEQMIDDAIEEGDISGEAEYIRKVRGIASLCFDRGFQALSPSQQGFYNVHIHPHVASRSGQAEIEDVTRGWPK